ncbi:WecB/TagA/CpsF family glycosyltransferase [Roseovarius sp. 2305UL8-3]|uniref:WecB/TagA/CpsF family glycosyltransferase n=1 Tax=Roseovarius conchicola TaxID=3121636 RepID=UPI003527E033
MQFRFHDQTITVNMPTRAALEAEVMQRFDAREGFALATVNLDHLVKMRASPAFTTAYAAQDLVVADGWPIAALSRLARRPVTLMPGSDMVIPLCQMAAKAGVKVGFLGSTDAALETARNALQDTVPGLEVAFLNGPAMGFDPSGAEAETLLTQLEEQDISLCFLALGAPKQEALAARGRAFAPSVGFASIGAGIDFLSGRQHRAPALMRRMGLEWLWRALSSPRRLIPRYARCFAILPAEIGKALKLRG